MVAKRDSGVAKVVVFVGRLCSLTISGEARSLR